MDTLSKKEQPPPEAAAPTPAAPSPAPTAEPAPEVSQAVTKGGLSPEEVGRQLVGFVKELTSNTEEAWVGKKNCILLDVAGILQI